MSGKVNSGIRFYRPDLALIMASFVVLLVFFAAKKKPSNQATKQPSNQGGADN
jgi:hypothetical protein